MLGPQLDASRVIIFLKQFYFIEVQLTYNIVLVSAVQHSYLVTHTHISSFPLWFIAGYWI